MLRELELDELIDVFRRCVKRHDSKCNGCLLSDEYGDDCIDIRDSNALKFLRKLYEIESGKKQTGRFKWGNGDKKNEA